MAEKRKRKHPFLEVMTDSFDSFYCIHAMFEAATIREHEPF
jgi:hypothetical protein